jgi:hypothetical protein
MSSADWLLLSSGTSQDAFCVKALTWGFIGVTIRRSQGFNDLIDQVPCAFPFMNRHQLPVFVS